MEEADHLCTRVGIMNHGKLRCLGSQNRLKAKYGSGYQLQFDADHGRVRGGCWAYSTDYVVVRALSLSLSLSLSLCVCVCVCVCMCVRMTLCVCVPICV